MLALIGRWVEAAPAGSQMVVEADERFDFGLLKLPERWDVREYPPAVVGIFAEPPRPRGVSALPPKCLGG
jgi:hypothetical protein